MGVPSGRHDNPEYSEPATLFGASQYATDAQIAQLRHDGTGDDVAPGWPLKDDRHPRILEIGVVRAALHGHQSELNGLLLQLKGVRIPRLQ